MSQEWIPVERNPERIREVGSDWGIGLVSISVMDAPAGVVLVEVGYQTGVAVLVPESTKENTISISVENIDGQTVFETIADELGLSARFEDGVVSFVKPDEAAVEFTVFRPGYLVAQDAVDALRSIVGSGGTVTTLGDRLVVTGDRRSVERAVEFRDELQIGQDGWMLEIRVVNVTKSLRRAVGLDWTLEARAGVRGGVGESGPFGPLPVTGLQAEFIASVLAKATEDAREAVLRNTATLFVLEGGNAELQQGDVVPVPRFQTSPAGTTTTTGFDFINTGLSIVVAAERVPDGVRLDIEPRVSTVTGFVREAPVISESSVKVTAIVRSGEWMIISGLDSFSGSSSSDGVPGIPEQLGMRGLDVTKGSLLFLIRAERVYASR
jgi:type II secretory pathway component GspD/PulD (secretin)